MNCEAHFEGLKADSCTVSSSSGAVATFNNGVPTTAVTGATPELLFDGLDRQDYAFMEAGAVVSNPLSITGASDVFSSFAGGQSLQITGAGLTSDVLLGKSEVRVCGRTCEIDEDNSDASQLTCKTPVMPTKRSILDYQVQ